MKLDTNFTNLRKLITVIILVLIGAQNLASLHAFTNRPSKPPVGARIDPLHPMNRGLVAWWLFNDGLGSSLTDITGKYPGSLTNMDANDWVGSPRGGALDFDGSNDHVDMGLQPDLEFNSGNFTITSWVKPNNVGGNNHIVTNYLSGYNGWILSIYLSKISFLGSATYPSANTTLSNGIWYHVAVTINSSGNCIFYLNGVADGSGTPGLPSGAVSNFRIGKDNASAAFNGLIDDVRIYKDRVLSADEIAELYRNPYVGLRQSPVKWYGVDDPAASFTPTVTWW